jgi:hypothetical protein
MTAGTTAAGRKYMNIMFAKPNSDPGILNRPRI